MIIDFVRRVSVRSLYDIIRDKKILVFWLLSWSLFSLSCKKSDDDDDNFLILNEASKERPRGKIQVSAGRRAPRKRNTRFEESSKKKNSGGIKKRRTRACDTHSHTSVCDLSVVLNIVERKDHAILCYSLLIIQKTFFAFKIEEKKKKKKKSNQSEAPFYRGEEEKRRVFKNKTHIRRTATTTCRKRKEKEAKTDEEGKTIRTRRESWFLRKTDKSTRKCWEC